MLGTDHQSGQWTRTEPGRDPGVFGRQREISIQGQNREAMCGWAARTLRPQRYQALGWAGRGLVREYVARMTGLSRAQVTRLIRQYPRGGQVQPKAYRRRRWK
jgi:hypothetical protein